MVEPDSTATGDHGGLRRWCAGGMFPLGHCELRRFCPLRSVALGRSYGSTKIAAGPSKNEFSSGITAVLRLSAANRMLDVLEPFFGAGVRGWLGWFLGDSVVLVFGEVAGNEADDGAAHVAGSHLDV